MYLLPEFEISVLTPTSMVDGRIDYLHSQDMAVLGWGALGGDPLAGANRLFNFDGDRQVRIRNALKEVAAELGPGKFWEYHERWSIRGGTSC